jgi:hypothetical protein
MPKKICRQLFGDDIILHLLRQQLYLAEKAHSQVFGQVAAVAFGQLEKPHQGA